MSDFAHKLEGKNYQFGLDLGYNNDKPPTDEKNQAAIKFMLEPIAEELQTQMQGFLSPYVIELLQFLRALLIARTNIPENV